MSEFKTNVMRILEQRKIKYFSHEYAHGETAVDGVTVAEITGMSPESVYKTLVTRGSSKGIYVFVIPVAQELDLKKAAKAAGEKSVAMLHVSELLSITGYIRGGCSPVGMKKAYPTFFHKNVSEQKSVMVSAGKIGYMIELSPNELIKLTGGKTADITV